MLDAWPAVDGSCVCAEGSIIPCGASDCVATPWHTRVNKPDGGDGVGRDNNGGDDRNTVLSPGENEYRMLLREAASRVAERVSHMHRKQTCSLCISIFCRVVVSTLFVATDGDHNSISGEIL